MYKNNIGTLGESGSYFHIAALQRGEHALFSVKFIVVQQIKTNQLPMLLEILLMIITK